MPLIVRFGGRFGYFKNFSAQGGGKGSLRRRGWAGIGFFYRKFQEGGGGGKAGRGPSSREGVCGELGNFGMGGGRAKYFFRAEMSTKQGFGVSLTN